MRLSDLLDVGCIHPDISAPDIRDCFRRMVSALAKRKAITDEAEAFDKLLEREKMMSTGIGGGIAIPHARCASLERTVLSIALSKEGIDFNAIDGNPVRIIFLMLGPQESAALHVKILAQIARLVKNREFVERLLNSQSADEIARVIREAESEGTKEDGVE